MNAEPTIAELRAWRETVRRGNLTLAARSLGVKQPTVHQLVDRLASKVQGGQEQLYTYSQSQREIQPTRVGLELVEAAEGVLRALDSAAQIVQAGQRVRRICVASTLGIWDECVLPNIARMKQRDPELVVEMLARGSSGAMKALSRRRCDIAIITAGQDVRVPEGARALDCAWAQNIDLVLRQDDEAIDWFRERLGRNRRSDIAPILRRVTKSTDSVSQLILPFKGSIYRRYVESVFDRHDVVIPSIQTFDTSYTILNAVWHGLGRAIHQTWPKSPYDADLERICMNNIFGRWHHQVVWNREAEDADLLALVEKIASGSDLPAEMKIVG